MKALFFFTLLIFGANIYAQDLSKVPSCGPAVLSLPHYKILYRDYENRFDYAACSDCDTLLMKFKGVEFVRRGANSGILTVDDEAERASVRFECVKGVDTLQWGAFGFRCYDLPNPKVYLGKVWVNDPLIDEKTDEETIFKTRFSARYDASTLVRGIKIKITEWSIIIGKRIYFGDSQVLSKEVREIIFESERNDAIHFNYVDLTLDGGNTRRIHINRIYHKKTEYNTRPIITHENSLPPEDQ